VSIHFEELWEKCEQLQKESSKEGSESSIVDELMMKLNLYQVIGEKSELSAADHEKIKSRTIGEILLTLTGLSYKDNINVFEALNVAMQYRTLESYTKK